MIESYYYEDFLAQQRESKAIRKDIATARTIITDGLARYKKKMLHARNLKQVEDLSMFAELDGYTTKRDIQDAYGWNFITETTMYRLWDLWDARETVIANNGKYADRVTQMLLRAMDNCGDIFADTLEAFDELERQDKEARLRIERENSITSYSRNKAG